MRSTIRLLRSIPDPEPPGDLVSNVMRRIRLGEAQPTRSERFIETLSQIFTPQFAVPATALAAGLAVFAMTTDLSFEKPGREGAMGPALVAATPLPSSILQRQSEPTSRISDGSSIRVATIPQSPRGAGNRSVDSNPSSRYLERVNGGDPLGPMTRQPRPSDGFASHRRFLGPVLGSSFASARDGLGTASTPGALRLGGGVYAPNYAPNYSPAGIPVSIEGEDLPGSTQACWHSSGTPRALRGSSPQPKHWPSRSCGSNSWRPTPSRQARASRSRRRFARAETSRPSSWRISSRPPPIASGPPRSRRPPPPSQSNEPVLRALGDAGHLSFDIDSLP